MAQSTTAEVKPMNQYETIMWEKEMKEQILSHARAVYGESYPQGTVFDVVHSTCTTTYEMDRAESLSYDINLIVYTQKDTPVSWEVLESCYSRVTAADGLNALLESLKFSLQIRISEKAKAEKTAAVKPERETGYIMKFSPDSKNGEPFAALVPRVR